MRLSVLWLALVACAIGQQVPATPPSSGEMSMQQSTPTFSSKVNLVIVPVVVRDRDGKAVGDLTKDDFRVFDKNKPQVIQRFSVEASARAAVPTAIGTTGEAVKDETAQSRAVADSPERYVMYVFDDLNTKFGDLVYVQKAAKQHFAEYLRPTDRAAIATTSGQTNLDFTSDRQKLQDTLMRIRPNQMFGSGRECPDVSYYEADLILNKNDPTALQAEIQEAMACLRLDPSQPGATQTAQMAVMSAAHRVLDISEQGSRVSLSALRVVVRRMSGMPGQRLVVILSPGFLTLEPEFYVRKSEILDLAARENVVISSVDARGLYTDSVYDASQPGAFTMQGQALKSQYDRQSASVQADILAELAEGTGGNFIENSNDLLGGLNRVAAMPDFVYLLTFTPDNLKADGSFHKLKVTLANSRGLSVQARRGYYAPKRDSKPEDRAKNEIEDAVFSREELHDLPVDLHTQFFKPDPADAKLTILAKVDVKRLRFKKADGRHQNDLTVVSVLFDRDGKYIKGESKTLNMKLKDETLERLNSGVVVRSSFDVKPGAYLVRLVVRDKEGQMMAANGAVDIP
jgi:VWFA-related protein